LCKLYAWRDVPKRDDIIWTDHIDMTEKNDVGCINANCFQQSFAHFPRTERARTKDSGFAGYITIGKAESVAADEREAGAKNMGCVVKPCATLCPGKISYDQNFDRFAGQS